MTRAGPVPSDDAPRSAAAKRRIRQTVRVVVLILVFTGLLVAIKYWVVSRYLLGH